LASGFHKLIENLRNPSDVNFRNQVYVFLICLTISVFIWFLIVLSNESYTTVNYPIVYKNAPENMVLVNHPDSVLTFRIASGGFELIILKYLTHRKPIEIDLKRLNLKKEGNYFVSSSPTSQISGDIIHNINLSEELVDISPQIIFFKFEPLTGKKVQVISDLDLQFTKQFKLSDSIVIIPDSVNILGAKNIISEIDNITTKREQVIDLDKDTRIKVRLEPPNGDQSIKLIPDEVEVFIPVEKFTEAAIEIPVTGELSNQMKIKTFPETVKITYTVSLNNYKRVNSDMFHAVVNYNPEMEEKILPVVLARKPSFIEVIKIDPAMVEFLVIKK